MAEKVTFNNFEDVSLWYEKSPVKRKAIYYSGFYVEDSEKSYEMRKLSKDLMNFEKKTRSIILYQKKISAGSESKQPVYDYYIERVK